MQFNISEHLPEDFAPESRVWIYQSSRTLLLSEAFSLEKMLEDFTAGWQAHGAPVKGFANLFFGRFIILMADEAQTVVSGCSIDSTVKLIREIEKQFQVDLFDRQSLAFLIKEKVQIIPLSQFNYALQNNFIQTDTPYFDNTVLTKKELEDKWIKPLKNSWLANKIIH
jgi:hypothetical protein